ncbi:MAG: VanZ family protein [Candidatus Omnitrophota bacterium]
MDALPISNKERLKVWSPVLFLMILIFCSSAIPGKRIPKVFNHQDIFLHLIVYLIMGFYFARALKKTFPKITPQKIIMLTTIFMVLYGASDEFHQAFVPNRTVSGMDLCMDSLGGFFGGLAYQWRK